MKQHLSRAISFLLLFYCAALILIIAGDYTFSQAITALQISAPAVLLVCAFYPLLVSCGSNQDSVSNFTPGFSLSTCHHTFISSCMTTLNCTIILSHMLISYSKHTQYYNQNKFTNMELSSLTQYLKKLHLYVSYVTLTWYS